MKTLIVLVCLLALGCSSPTAESSRNWQVEDVNTKERVGEFASKQEADAWIRGWKRQREQGNDAAESHDLGGGVSASEYEFDRELKAVRK